jgi:hypothetical protein
MHAAGGRNAEYGVKGALPGALHQFLPVSGYIHIYKLLRGVLGALYQFLQASGCLQALGDF